MHDPPVLDIRVRHHRSQAAPGQSLQPLGVRHPQQVADGREQVHHLGKLAPLGAGVGGARQADHQRHPDRRLVQVAHLAGHAVLAELVAMIGHQHHEGVVERFRCAQRGEDAPDAVVQQRDQRQVGGYHLPARRVGIGVPAPPRDALDRRPRGAVRRRRPRRQRDPVRGVEAGIFTRRIQRRVGCVDADERRERRAAGAAAQVVVELPAGHQVAILLRRSLEHAGDPAGVLQVAVVVESHGGHLVVGDRPEAAVGAVRLAERHAVEAVPGEMVAEIALAGRQAVGVVQHAELVRVAPGDHRGARRHAHRVVGKAVAERHRFGAQRIDVRGAHEGILLVEQHVLARLVGHDQHQVGHRGLPRLSYPCRRRECRLRVGWLAARHGRRVPHWRTA